MEGAGGGGGGHVFCVIMTQCVRKSTCDSPLTKQALLRAIKRLLKKSKIAICQQRCIQNPFEHLRQRFFAKIVNGFQLFDWVLNTPLGRVQLKLSKKKEKKQSSNFSVSCFNRNIYFFLFKSCKQQFFHHASEARSLPPKLLSCQKF